MKAVYLSHMAVLRPNAAYSPITNYTNQYESILLIRVTDFFKGESRALHFVASRGAMGVGKDRVQML